MAEDKKDKLAWLYINIDELGDIAEMYEAADLPTFVAIDPSNPAATIGKVSGSKIENI